MVQPNISFETIVKQLGDANVAKDALAHEEMVYLIVNQTYELWLKEVLHEATFFQVLLANDNTAEAAMTARRVSKILGVLLSQMDLVETMSSAELAKFGEVLEAGNAFRPIYVRQLEFLVGHRQLQVLERFRRGTQNREVLEALFDAPSLWDSFLLHVTHFGYEIPSECLQEYRTTPIVPCEELQALLKKAYKENRQLASLFDALIELDGVFQNWRSRHVRMVERVLTAETDGYPPLTVGFLKNTLPRPLFPDLWAIREELSS